MGPEVTHHPLVRADGSIAFSDSLFSVTAAVNGPVEVQRRDELPDEAAIEVNVRPASGVGGPRERWLETVVSTVLRSVLLVHLHPRTLIQITLQVTKEPSLQLKGAIRDTAILPTLINAAFLALVDGALPLETTIAAVLGAVLNDDVKIAPVEKDLAACQSVHAFVYNQKGEQLLDESSGKFSVTEWEEVADASAKWCHAAISPGSEDAQMDDGAAESMPWLRQELHERMVAASAWRGQ